MRIRFVSALVMLTLVAFGCGGDASPNDGADAGLSASNDITAFTLPDLGNVSGVIDQTNRTIVVTLAYGVSRTLLLPMVTTTGASVSPLGAQDFTNPVVYTVTAENGATKTYTVTVQNLSNTNVDLSTVTFAYDTLSHPLTPAFSPSVTSYTATVPGDVTISGLSWLAADAGATVTASANATALVEGPNTVTLTVTQPGGAMKVYTFVITRLPPGALVSETIGPVLLVPGGTFQRDATGTNTSQVSSFHMARTEVTRAQWVTVTGLPDPTDVSDATRITGTNDPVDGVSWFGAVVFCNRLSVREGLTPVYSLGGSTNPDDWGALPTTDSGWSSMTADWAANGYRLPTEMEWLWAAMGATSGSGYPGSGVFTTGYAKPFAGSNGTNQGTDYAWYFSNCKNANNFTQTRPVATKLANELGIFDLSGSVYEWVWDNSPGGTKWPDGALVDFRGAATWSDYHIAYGGSYSFELATSIGASRYAVLTATSALSAYHLGLRVVRN